MIQNIQEGEHVYVTWMQGYAPKDLLQTPENQKAIAEYIRLYHGSIVSITSLNDAVANLPTLQRKPKMTAAEFESIELRRRQREQTENNTNWMETNKAITDAQVAKKENEKTQAVAINAINTAIESYEVYRGPGRRDFALMDQRKNKLRAYREANKHRDQKIVLGEIRTMILNFPDPNERMR